MVREISSVKRLLQNLTTGKWHLRRLLGSAGASAITEAVSTAERATSAQIKVVIESSLDLGPLCRGQTARERALEVFGLERVWDTSGNNGILLYLLVAERDAEIVVDRGFNKFVAPNEWEGLCSSLTREIAVEGFLTAIVRTVERIGAIASRAFPTTGSVNELSDDLQLR
jgi:uncharacterized membrane protein